MAQLGKSGMLTKLTDPSVVGAVPKKAQDLFSVGGTNERRPPVDLDAAGIIFTTTPRPRAARCHPHGDVVLRRPARAVPPLRRRTARPCSAGRLADRPDGLLRDGTRWLHGVRADAGTGTRSARRRVTTFAAHVLMARRTRRHRPARQGRLLPARRRGRRLRRRSRTAMTQGKIFGFFAPGGGASDIIEGRARRGEARRAPVPVVPDGTDLPDGCDVGRDRGQRQDQEPPAGGGHHQVVHPAAAGDHVREHQRRHPDRGRQGQ